MSGTVYEIAKWKTVFETAESRKLKNLNWVSVPVSFSSSGYQQMLDEFEGDAPAIYGAWIALVAFAASCPSRGVLANSRGKSLPISHIARVTGFQSEIFERLIAWASGADVAWLTVVADPVRMAENTEKHDDSSVSGESPDDLPEPRENPPSTRQDKTRPNQTRQDPTAAAASAAAGAAAAAVAAEEVDDFFAGVDLAAVRSVAARLRSAAPTLHRDVVWRSAAIGQVIDPELIPDVIRRLAAREIGKPESYLEKLLREECDRLGQDYRRIKKRAPPTPPPAAKAPDAGDGGGSGGPPASDPVPTAAFKRPPRPERSVRVLDEFGSLVQRVS